MNEIKDYQGILREKAARAEDFFKKYPAILPDQARLFSEINDTKIRTVAPEIMVYGIYNAGKSSILNELIGKDVATVRDVPETDKVSYYDWQGYRIADTPGVSAPIAHENVTQEHLKKADIVLFVMSTTGSNEKRDNYVRMKEIADAGKKIIIVLNDKDGDLGHKDEERAKKIQTIKQQVAKNMQQVGIENVDEKYCIVTVNAARAHKGRTEGKTNLLAQSGMDELKDVVLSELKRTSSFNIIRNAISQIQTILGNFIDSLEHQENSELLQKMNRVLETFNQQKILIRRQINTFIDTQADMLGQNLPELIWSHRQESDGLDDLLKQELDRLNQKVQTEIQRQIEDTVSVLSLELQSFADINLESHDADAESFKNILDNLAQVNATLAKGAENENGFVDVGQSSGNAVDLPASIATANFAGKTIAEGSKIIIKNLAKTTIGKAIAGTAVGKILGSAVGTVIPIIGPILTIISVISWLGGGNDDRKRLDAQLAARNEQERQRVEAEKQARQDLKQKCLYLADNIAGELKEAADKIIAEILAQYEKPFKDEIVVRRDEGQQLMDDVVQLRDLYNEYDLLKVELGAR